MGIYQLHAATYGYSGRGKRCVKSRMIMQADDKDMSVPEMRAAFDECRSLTTLEPGEVWMICDEEAPEFVKSISE